MWHSMVRMYNAATHTPTTMSVKVIDTDYNEPIREKMLAQAKTLGMHAVPYYGPNPYNLSRRRYGLEDGCTTVDGTRRW